MRILIFLLLLVNVAVAQDVGDLEGEFVPAGDTTIAVVDTIIPVGPFNAAKYPYVKAEYNMMLGTDTSRGNSFAFWPLFDSLLINKDFRINVLHFGGSHIQADVYSNLLRDSLQSLREGIAGPRGLVFPFEIIKTNNPRNYQVKHTGTWQGHRSSVSYHTGTWGLTGITASTTDTLASITLKVNASCASTPFTEVKVLCDTASKYELTLSSQGAVVHVERNLAAGYYRFFLSEATDSLHLVIRKTDTTSTIPFELYGIILDNEEPGIAYHSIGANGASFKSNFRGALFQQHLVEVNPDLVIISIGTNDSFDGDFTEDLFTARYDTFIQMIKAVNSDVQFIFTVPNDSYYKRKYPNLNTAKIQSAIYRLAMKHNGLVWDFYKIMGELKSAKTWMYAGMMKKDLIHFTNEGYILKGQLFWDAFMRSYKNYLESKPTTADPH